MTTSPKVTLNAAFLHQLEIMKALAEGTQVQARPINTTAWSDYEPSSLYQSMNFLSYEFRIKSPDPRVFYLILRANGEHLCTLTEEKVARSMLCSYNADPRLAKHQPCTCIKVVEEIK